jgi:hypothetical protein
MGCTDIYLTLITPPGGEAYVRPQHPASPSHRAYALCKVMHGMIKGMKLHNNPFNQSITIRLSSSLEAENAPPKTKRKASKNKPLYEQKKKKKKKEEKNIQQ